MEEVKRLYSNELYHYGVKGMKWGVRRYQNKDGSLTRLGKKTIRKDIEKSKIPQKYKAYRKANEAYYNNADKLDKQNKLLSEVVRTSHKYDMSVYKMKNSFLNKYGNKRVSEVRELSDKGQEEVRRLLKESEKDRSIWDKNIDIVRRANAYENEKNFNKLKFDNDITKEIDRVYNKTYGEHITTSTTTKESKDSYERFLKNQMKKNKKNGYY